jgi:hypothetical protein
MTSHFGVDISSNNPHPINFGALFSYLKNLGGGGQPFVIVKATQGTDYTNPDFTSDVAAAKAVGFAVAAYLMDEGTADPAAEERAFKLVAGNTIAQFDDIELPDGLSQADYIAHTQALIAQADVLQYLNQSEVASGFPTGAGLWLADYNGAPGTTSYACLIHQYTSTGVVPGDAGQFNMNYWMGTEAQFASTFGNPQPVPPAPPVIPWPSQTNRAAAVPTGGVLATRPDGGVFAYGCGFYGSMAGHPLSAPIIGIAPTKTGKGYWLAGADGGVFGFGDAGYHGSAPANPSWGIGTKLNPVVGIALDESKANGYVLIADSGAGPAPATYYLNETTHYK